MRMIIAIDGPAGSGKSTVAGLISKKYDINYMDTGAMYRAFALALFNRGILISDADKVRAEIDNIDVTVEYREDGQHVFVDGKDVNGLIRTPEIAKGASDVGVYPEVRKKLAAAQRQAAEKFEIVMDGRDIGTFVLPDAPLKFFLTASCEVRAKRRQEQLKAAGIEKDIDELIKEMAARDKTDSEREFAPLRRAEDALYIDTSDMNIEEVMAEIDTAVKRTFR